jgi:7-cyano-7-deazaguanine synthase
MARGSQASAVVLLSAGLDSTYNLLKACGELSVRLALTFDYGQKAAAREVSRAAEIAAHFKVPHEVIQLPWFAKFTTTALVGSETLATGQDIEIDNLERSLETAKNVWVPNRNGIFLNIAAGFAEGLEAALVIPGFNAEEAATFPDNTGAFLGTLDACWKLSTDTGVRAFCFSTDMSKSEIVADAKANLPFTKMWPCYLAGETWCGSCESCQRFARAVNANGLSFKDLQKASFR